MSTHKPLVIGNWKLNPSTIAEAKALFVAIRKKLKPDAPVTVVVAPPFPFIADLARLSPSGRVVVAAQDVFSEDSGAFTGEVSANMLASQGVTQVIIGHSERRAMGETDAQVAAKVAAALRRKLTPVVCVGETVRDGSGSHFGVVEAQVRALAAGLTARALAAVVIAYEPIWAIGTGKNATPEDVEEMHLFIRTLLTKLHDRATGKRVRIIYGGSVKPENAAALHAAGMDGFLVGGASLSAESFNKIILAVLPA
jgi:triosephosphate isomerase